MFSCGTFTTQHLQCGAAEFQVMDPLTASEGLKRDTKGDKGRKPNSFIASFLR